MESLRKWSFAGLTFMILSLALACERGPAPLEDTPENRAAQSERYLEAMPPEALVKDMVSRMSQRMPDEQRTQFVDAMTKQFDMQKLRTIMREGMAKHFTAEEIRALADFYGSELGRSAMGKFGTYMSEVMPAIQAEVMVAVGKVREEMASAAAQPPAAQAPPAGAPAAGAPAEPPKAEPAKE